MRRYAGSLAVILTILVALSAGSEAALSAPGLGSERAGFAPGRVLIKLEEGAPAAALGSLNARNGARVEEKIPGVGVSVVDLPAGLSVAEAVRRYEASPKVEYAEPDYLLYPDATPNDPRYPEQWALNNTGQTGGTADADVDAPEAWDVTVGGAETAVAIIDSGVDLSHPDLDGNVWTNADEVAGNGVDDDGNGYVDDIHGWDFRNDDGTVFDTGERSHGTHVAGIVAAEGNNGAGVVGVGWRTRIASLKFIGPQSGYTSDAAEALDYAVAEGIEISNNSYGCLGCFSTTLRDAVRRADAAGHLFVAAAGNDGANTDTQVHYPSGYDDPNVVSVAATGYKDGLTGFSNRGLASVDLAAPGSSILSTVPGGGYASYSGTSMASPHVAGAAALVGSKFPELDDAGIKARLLESVDRKTGLVDKVASGGRLNAGRAVGAPELLLSNRPPSITGLRPVPGSRTRDRTPPISATVRDAGTDLTSANIALYLDGRRVSVFSYNRTTDRLAHVPRTGLSLDRLHTVKIVVRDAQGLTSTRTWRFKVTS